MSGEAEQDGQTNDAATETPAEFLAILGKKLREKEGVDEGLVDILCAHILKTSPSQDTVNQTKSAILTLAANRANPPKVEDSDD